jgi:hypothetical protein
MEVIVKVGLALFVYLGVCVLILSIFGCTDEPLGCFDDHEPKIDDEGVA